MKVIGTAGHVDHGKTTLVKALTGIDPDRLKEEKDREMTIELGFAWMEMPDGELVGIVDVPGHRDFIENMLAGVGGIDAIILVIEADEGIMPQTIEHLNILKLLEIDRGVIALTKIDMIEDSEWINLMIKDIRAAVKNSFLEKADIVPISAKSGFGIDDLIKTIEKELKNGSSKIDKKKPRLSVDRVFSIQGFGTVITGTLMDGKLTIGDDIVILPSGKKGRVRGLQTHKKKIETAEPGSRVAVNVANLEVNEIARGNLLTKPDMYFASHRIDAFISILEDARKPLIHNSEIKVFLLASEHMGRIRLLGSNQFNPGESGYVQIEFSEPIIAEKNDHFILRIPSPGETIGGGIVLKTDPPQRYKRFSDTVIQKIMASHIGTIDEKILDFVLKLPGFTMEDISKGLDRSIDEIERGIQQLILQGDILEINQTKDSDKITLYVSTKYWEYFIGRVKKFTLEYHKAFPLRNGIPKDELRTNLQLENDRFNYLYQKILDQNIINEFNQMVSDPSHNVVYKKEQLEKIHLLDQEWEKNPYSPPDYEYVRDFLGLELFNSLLVKNTYVRVSKNVFFRKKEFDEMLSFTTSFITENGKITVAEFRDKYNSSRKYTLAFLEYLDKTGVTVREGDFRILAKTSKQQE
jgi:selenocysteine-specific elongation factor